MENPRLIQFLGRLQRHVRDVVCRIEEEWLRSIAVNEATASLAAEEIDQFAFVFLRTESAKSRQPLFF